MVLSTIGDAAMGPLIGAMGALKDQIKAAMSFADNAQKASLALGQTYEQTRDSLGSSMEGLRGDINQRFGAAIAGMEAGLQGNTAGVAKLINQQQLTGTAYQATAKAFAGLEAGMNLSRDDTNALSESLINTGAEYGVSTDKLVGAIDALKDTFPAQKLAGMGKDVMGAVASLQSELGPALAGPLNKVMKAVFDPSQSGMEQLTKLGLEGVREQLSAAKSSEEAQKILKDAFVRASDTFKMHAGGADQFFRQTGVAMENLGTAAIDFTTVADAFGDRTRQEIDQTADFGKTLANLKNEIMVPFQEGLAVAYPFLLEAMDVISGIMNTVGERFKKFAESLGGEDGAAATMKKFKLAVIDFSIIALGKLEGTFGFMKKIITQTVPSAFGMLSDAITNFASPGGPLDHLKFGFAVLAGAAGKIGEILSISGAGLLRTSSREMSDEMKQRIQAVQAGEAGRGVFGGKTKEESQFVLRMIDQGKGVFESMRLLSDFRKDPEKFGFGARLKEMADMSFGPGAKRSPMFQELSEMRANIEAGNAMREKSVETLGELNDKTPELETKSEFLGETANMLSASIEQILGIREDTTSKDILEELVIANIQRGSATGSPAASTAPQIDSNG